MKKTQESNRIKAFEGHVIYAGSTAGRTLRITIPYKICDELDIVHGTRLRVTIEVL